MSKPGLPACRAQHPSCGACDAETDFDGDVFVCWGCGLNYGDGDDYTVAEFLDEDTVSCGIPCDNGWHRPHKIKRGEGYECQPCALPNGHDTEHWTNCVPVTIEGKSE